MPRGVHMLGGAKLTKKESKKSTKIKGGNFGKKKKINERIKVKILSVKRQTFLIIGIILTHEDLIIIKVR